MPAFLALVAYLCGSNPFQRSRLMTMKKQTLNLLLCCLTTLSLLAFQACVRTPDTKPNLALDSLELNKIQFVTSQNSFRIRTYEPILQHLQGLSGLPDFANPMELDYTHETLEDQLNTYQIRGLELAVYHDPTGGRFYNRGGNSLVGQNISSNVAALQQPGFKVLNLPDIDYQTHHYTFKSALEALKAWSDAHPNHFPIFVTVKCKEDDVYDYFNQSNFSRALPFSVGAADSLDNEVKSVFGDLLEKVITPDELRGEFATLREMVAARKLPILRRLRGRFFFIVESDKDFYVQGHEGLQGRVMFQYCDSPYKPEAAFLRVDNPIDLADSIRTWVKMGFLVRTKADFGTHEARSGDNSRFVAALQGGAHLVATDYYRPDTRYLTDTANWSAYKVNLPNNVLVRPNPVSTNPNDYAGWIFKEF